jgi:hypothetical protein
MAMATDTATQTAGDARGARRVYAIALAALTLLFSLRVSGQAVQRWVPQSYLPSFDAFQGSDLPYAVLFATQLVILALMVNAAYGVASGRAKLTARTTRVLWWAGAVYLAGSIGRIVVGVAYARAPAWFTTWIPAFFHVVLAAFVLTLAAAHASVNKAKIERPVS